MTRERGHGDHRKLTGAGSFSGGEESPAAVQAALATCGDARVQLKMSGAPQGGGEPFG